MKAQIIEQNPDAVEIGEVDPITLNIIESALRNTRYEMDAVLFRTAMSPGIREQHDEFPLIADRKGRMVVGQFGSFVDGFIKSWNGTIEEGDIFLTNDPYSCDGAVSHLNDWLVLLPIFYEGSLVGWGAMFGHMTDVGGKVPGSLPTDATTIFEEGVRIPPMKIYRKGELNSEMLEMILKQCRLPHWNRSDFNAIVAACRTAERRVKEMCARFGKNTYCSALEAALARNREAMRQLFHMSVSEETISFEDYICDDGRGYGPYKLKCSMRREGDKVILDWTGTDPQATGSINYYLNENLFKMFFGVYMIMVFDPQILFNDGFYDLVEVKMPEGSLVKPKYPAALSCRTHGLGRMFDVLGGLLGQRQPEFLNAAGFSSSPHLMYSGTDKKGEWYQLFQIGFGGIPGKPFGDGPDGHSLWPSFTNVPNEFLEAYFPLRIEKYRTVTDSGGAGKHRGGNGVEIEYCFLEPGEISIHDDRWFLPPWGVNGGQPAKRSTKLLMRTDGTEEVLPAKCDRIQVKPGDRLSYITWGGGGWGDPLERDPALVARDVRRQLVSKEAAKENYGVVLSDAIEVDGAATIQLREEMKANRGELPVFNYGRTLEELRASCKEETGLDAPKPPVFA
ncbi:MAG: hydantoinase B/oxoprolinase family protein [Cyclobacteriaceae bacterium]